MYNFTRAAKGSKTLKDSKDQPAKKSVFLLKPSVVGVKIPAKFHREKTNSIFTKLSEIIGIDEGKMSISYPARKSKKKVDWITIEMNPHINDCLELMYQQLESIDKPSTIYSKFSLYEREQIHRHRISNRSNGECEP